MRLSRIQGLFAVCALATSSFMACDDSSPDGAAVADRNLSIDESVLVCVTALAPDGLDPEQLDEIYEAWSDTGSSRDGYVTNYLFRFEDEPGPSSRYMFALVFSGDPNGLEAAATHREQESAAFREYLEGAGFTNVSLQSNLLYVNGIAAPEDSHPAAH